MKRQRFLTTKIQDEIMEYWHTYTEANGRPPTMEDARRGLGYAKISSVQRHLLALEKKGLMKREFHKFWYVA